MRGRTMIPIASGYNPASIEKIDNPQDQSLGSKVADRNKNRWEQLQRNTEKITIHTRYDNLTLSVAKTQ